MRSRSGRESSTAVVGSGQPPGVRFDGITTVFDDQPVLHRLALDVPAGQITVLMGPSGAGKTTLVRHLCGLLEPDRGTVEIGGRNVWDASPQQLQEIRRGMSVLLGGSSLFDSSLFGSLSAYENLEYGLKHRDVSQAERERRVMARLREVALDHVAEQTPDMLAAHARRRLALARALVTDSPLLVLDDVDVCLDAAHSQRILEAIANWRHRTNGTLLLTTHKIGLARELGDNLAILTNGRIVSTGNARELLSGVETNEQFDHRFQISDFMGPPRLEDVRAGEDEERGLKIHFTVDPQMVRAAMVAAVAVAIIVMFGLYSHLL
jgi:phospholipid/cholesterol/gamma-HCH transport system ATP-binding protein